MTDDITPDQVLSKLQKLWPAEQGRILERLTKEAFQLRLDLADPSGATIVGADVPGLSADDVAAALAELLALITAGASPLTTKGDLYTHDGTTDVRLPGPGGFQDLALLQGWFASDTGLRWRQPADVRTDIEAAPAVHGHTAGDISGLADVATSGDYNDLINTPTPVTPGGADRQFQINNAAAFGGGQLFSLSNGALSYHFPDDSPAGGIARGNQAVDLQSSRSAAGQVATGNRSFSAGGSDNLTSGDNSATLGGVNNLASGTDAVSIGGNLNAAEGNQSSVIGGIENSAVGDCSSIQGGNGNVVDATYGSCRTGVLGWSYLYGQEARGAGSVGGNFAGQSSSLFLTGRTADATPTALLLFDVAGQHASLQNHFRWYADVRIIAGTTTAVAKSASFHRKVMIRRGADAASTSLIGSVQTIGADIGTNSGSPPAGWAVSIDADTTNGALRVTVTGEAATDINWLAEVSILELGEIF